MAGVARRRFARPARGGRRARRGPPEPPAPSHPRPLRGEGAAPPHRRALRRGDPRPVVLAQRPAAGGPVRRGPIERARRVAAPKAPARRGGAGVLDLVWDRASAARASLPRSRCRTGAAPSSAASPSTCPSSWRRCPSRGLPREDAWTVSRDALQVASAERHVLHARRRLVYHGEVHGAVHLYLGDDAWDLPFLPRRDPMSALYRSAPEGPAREESLDLAVFAPPSRVLFASAERPPGSHPGAPPTARGVARGPLDDAARGRPAATTRTSSPRAGPSTPSATLASRSGRSSPASPRPSPASVGSRSSSILALMLVRTALRRRRASPCLSLVDRRPRALRPSALRVLRRGGGAARGLPRVRLPGLRGRAAPPRVGRPGPRAGRGGPARGGRLLVLPAGRGARPGRRHGLRPRLGVAAHPRRPRRLPGRAAPRLQQARALLVGPPALHGAGAGLPRAHPGGCTLRPAHGAHRGLLRPRGLRAGPPRRAGAGHPRPAPRGQGARGPGHPRGLRPLHAPGHSRLPGPGRGARPSPLPCDLGPPPRPDPRDPPRGGRRSQGARRDREPRRDQGPRRLLQPDGGRPGPATDGPGAEQPPGGLGGDGPAGRPRGEEPADPHPALGRAPAAGVAGRRPRLRRHPRQPAPTRSCARCGLCGASSPSSLPSRARPLPSPKASTPAASWRTRCGPTRARSRPA